MGWSSAFNEMISVTLCVYAHANPQIFCFLFQTDLVAVRKCLVTVVSASICTDIPPGCSFSEVIALWGLGKTQKIDEQDELLL